MDRPPAALEGAATPAHDPDRLLDRLLEDATVVVAYSDLLARHARELAPAHHQILRAIHEAAARLRGQLLAASVVRELR
jgi:hypothetical protein